MNIRDTKLDFATNVDTWHRAVCTHDSAIRSHKLPIVVFRSENKCSADVLKMERDEMVNERNSTLNEGKGEK